MVILVGKDQIQKKIFGDLFQKRIRVGYGSKSNRFRIPTETTTS